MLNKLNSVNKKLTPGLRKIIHNIGWLSLERILMLVLTFFVGIQVVRYLGPENYGKLAYSISFVGLFSVISKLGLDQIVIRKIVQQEESTKEILGTAFVLKLICSFLTIIFVAAAIWTFIDDTEIRWTTLIIGIGMVFSAFDVIDFWFQSQVLSRPMALVRSTQLILTITTKLLLIFWKFPLMAFAWVFIAEFVLKAIGMTWVYCKNSQSIFHWQVSWTMAKELLKDSWPLILSGVMITIYMRIDQVMLGNLTNNEAVGNYAAAVKFSEIWYFVPGAICSSVFPSIIRARQRSKQEGYRRLQQLFDLMAWISLSFAIVVTFVSNALIINLIGQDYASAGKILTLHIWASPFVFLGIAQSQWLVTENFTQFSFAITSLGALANICLNILLIPAYGSIGAALATVISQAIPCYLVYLIYPPMFNTGRMLTKALLIPFRLRQNIIYLKRCQKLLS